MKANELKEIAIRSYRRWKNAEQEAEKRAVECETLRKVANDDLTRFVEAEIAERTK